MKYLYITCLLGFFALHTAPVMAQSCPVTATTNVSSYPNTYFAAVQANLNAGSTSIVMGAAGYGTVPVSTGDILLVIQMQGAQINSSNNNSYGIGGSSGSGYLTNSNLLAGNMEYVLATNSIPISGGTVNIASGLTNSYKNANFGTDGKYSYQIIRVPVYYDLKLTGTISTPRWNGSTGGVLVLYATNNLTLNSQLINAFGTGFRGGAGRQLSGGAGSFADYTTLSTNNANGSKGEGLAGTPRYINYINVLVDNGSANEGYPGGSYGQGAPGNAGGGGTDGNPSSNDENTGGGGGSNGGNGGKGGNAWNSGKVSGGLSGAVFSQASPSRMVLGGGGGAGTTNNGTGFYANGFSSSGTAGGGMVIIKANAVLGTGTINANGSSANGTVLNDGTGGGGAGGSVMIFAATGSLTGLTITANGGNGGNNQAVSGASHGPGGGGGGGFVYSNMPLNASSSVNGGIAGTTSGNTTNYGSTAGSSGVLIQNITQAQLLKFPLSCATLPTEFLSLEAKEHEGLINVSWEVSNEAGVQEYLVEKSIDGNSFTVISSTPSLAGAATSNHYNYPDHSNAYTGSLYYRIKTVDQSGQFKYSKTVTLLISTPSTHLSVYPNPARSSATVSFVSSVPGAITLSLFDLKGSLVWQKQFHANNGLNNLSMDDLHSVPNGLYLLQRFDGLKQEMVKLIVAH